MRAAERSPSPASVATVCFQLAPGLVDVEKLVRDIGREGTHACDYLLAIDMDMVPDFAPCPCPRISRIPPAVVFMVMQKPFMSGFAICQDK